MENKLQVRNLRISFRTSNGKVQAVRGIDFELAEGETLAIVGESGSGKSVTSRAILGISAGNAIVESGEIIYDGQDLLKISEEDFHKIRGDKIAMIFQDPMSSLDPIVKIGRQLTEAMILKGKIRQRQSRKTFNAYLKNMSEAMAQSAESPADAEKAGVMCKTFDKFEFKHVELESGYNYAHEAACEAAEDIDKISFEFEKGSVGKDAADRINDIVRQSRESINAYVVPESKKDEIFELTDSMKKNFAHKDYMASVADMKKIRAILGEAIAKKAPNFFRLGYYLTFSDQPVPEMGVDEIDAFMKEYLDKNFMLEFIADATRALKYSEERCQNNIKKAVEELKASAPVFARETLDKKECYETLKSLEATVKSTIDPLAVSKDSLIYTFPSSMKSEIDKYFKDSKSNVRIMNKYEREKRKYDALIAKGKKPGFELAEAAVTNLDLIKSNVKHLIDRLVAHYNEILAENAERSYDKDALRCIDYLVENASGVTKKVTRQIAKHKAIKLMEEVGISEPHKRYDQYPFEFSGGMRQRIVIAIALAADPDILICDEPTTALDVTIQSQILELINKLKEERRLSVIFITHDLGVVANIADRVAVMYAGKIVEYGTSEDIFYHSAHPYTWALLSSMPDLDTNEKLAAIPGTPPNMIYPPKGDAFAARNKYAMAIDFERQPPMFKITDTHYAATWLLHPDAPHVDPPKAVTDRIARMNARREQR